MGKPTFAYLLLKEHPYGREMLRQILSEGFIPSIIITEDSAIGDEEREKFLKRIEGNDIAPTIGEQLAELEVQGIDVPHISVPIHNSEHVMPHIENLELDLIVFGGTRIIRGEILDHPKDGVINSHPGLLPDCRGSASPAWSVYHDIPIGSSTHFCDNGIDTGELLLRREVSVTRGMTYEDLCYETLVLAGVLMKEALVAYEDGKWDEMRHPQGESEHPTFRNAPEEVLEVVRGKLAELTYAHYVNNGCEKMDVKSPLANDTLNGKHAIVCGASSGIGRATALTLAKAGATLTLISRSADKLAELANECIDLGANNAFVLPIDLEDGRVIDGLLPKHIKENGPIHILINNAAGPPSGPLLEASDEDFLKPLRRHLFAAQKMVKHCLPSMEEEGYGRIVNIISTSVREPIANLGVSNTVRGAMAGWSKTYATELPSCVSINNILPGFTDTGRLDSLASQISEKRGCSPDEVRAGWLAGVPADRLIDPAETAAAIAFLCTDVGGAIKGVSLAVDGGRMRSI